MVFEVATLFLPTGIYPAQVHTLFSGTSLIQTSSPAKAIEGEGNAGGGQASSLASDRARCLSSSTSFRACEKRSLHVEAATKELS